MRKSTSRRMGFPRRKKGYENKEPVIPATGKEFAKEMRAYRESEAYKRQERLMLEADAMKKEIDDFYDFD